MLHYTYTWGKHFSTRKTLIQRILKHEGRPLSRRLQRESANNRKTFRTAGDSGVEECNTVRSNPARSRGSPI